MGNAIVVHWDIISMNLGIVNNAMGNLLIVILVQLINVFNVHWDIIMILLINTVINVHKQWMDVKYVWIRQLVRNAIQWDLHCRIINVKYIYL